MKKNFWAGILVIVLVFGMVVIGCDDGSTGNGNGNGSENGNSNGNGNGGGGNPFVGTWRYSNTGSTTTITFYADLTLEWVVSGAYVTSSTSYGTYSYSGNTATLNVNGGTSMAILNNSSSFNMGGFTFSK